MCGECLPPTLDEDMLGYLAKGRIFIKLDMREAYYYARIKKGRNGKLLSTARWVVSNSTWSLLDYREPLLSSCS